MCQFLCFFIHYSMFSCNSLGNTTQHFESKFLENKKIKYFVIREPFPRKLDIWRNQAIQRELIKRCPDDKVIP